MPIVVDLFDQSFLYPMCGGFLTKKPRAHSIVDANNSHAQRGKIRRRLRTDQSCRSRYDRNTHDDCLRVISRCDITISFNIKGKCKVELLISRSAIQVFTNAD